MFKMYRIIGEHLYGSEKIMFYHGTTDGVTAYVIKLNELEFQKAVTKREASLVWERDHYSKNQRLLIFYDGLSDDIKSILSDTSVIHDRDYIVDSLTYSQERINNYLEQKDVVSERTYRWELLDISEYDMVVEQDV